MFKISTVNTLWITTIKLKSFDQKITFYQLNIKMWRLTFTYVRNK